jgi:hypothetical protein
MDRPLKKISVQIGFVLLINLTCAAQHPDFYLGFDQILDNREYFTRYADDQTIFGARINPGVAFGFDSLHAVYLGINYMVEFGGDLLGVKPQLDLYYSYQAEHLQMKFGSFPRREVMEYPLFLLTDSLDYYRPNLEGASIRYQWSWGTVHGWVDWTGRASQETRESILAGIDATLRLGMFYVAPTATRYHLARSRAPDDMNQVRDDGSILVLAGVDLSDRLFFDQLEFASGLATTYKQQRPARYYQWFNGWYSRLDIRYWIFGIKGTCYFGDPSPLAYGDPLYTSGNYARIDLFMDPFKNPRISSKFAWNFHILPWDGLYMSQQILIHISL